MMFNEKFAIFLIVTTSKQVYDYTNTMFYNNVPLYLKVLIENIKKAILIAISIHILL